MSCHSVSRPPVLCRISTASPGAFTALARADDDLSDDELPNKLDPSLDLLQWSPVTPVLVSGTPDEQLFRYPILPGNVPRAFFRFGVTQLP